MGTAIFIVSLFAQPLAAATNYFIDSVTGLDSNSGTSPSAAWQGLTPVNSHTFEPGDHIYFKSGSSWLGQLAPKGSGTPGNPIVIDAYGEGPMPIINGGGVDGAAVYLYNVEHWEIQNLEITNPAETDSSRRIGLQVNADTLTTPRHIHLRRLVVHDVTGNNDFYTGKASGGIQFNFGAGFLHYDDILIESCVVRDVKRVGITVNGGTTNQSGGWATNVRVRNNTIYATGGDPMIIRFCASPLIEHNVAHDFPTGGSSAMWTAGMWSRSCSNAVFQFNEVYNSTTTWDGEAFDSDIFCIGTVFQYNYSHDNAGGFMLLMNSSSDNIVRYNVSRNDRNVLINFGQGVSPNARIYNNTFIITGGTSPEFISRSGADDATKQIYFHNNIIYNQGSPGSYASFGGLVSDYNCYFGSHPAGEPVENHKLTGDPKLARPGDGTIKGFQLLPSSPCINAGMTIDGFVGGDQWMGWLIDGKTDIGAHEFPAAPTLTTAPRTNGDVDLGFSTTTNRVYALEYRNDLSTGIWLNMTNGILGSGEFLTVTDQTATNQSARFYRISTLPR